MAHAARPINRSRLIGAACAVVVLLGGCTGGSDEPSARPSSRPSAAAEAPTLESVAQDLMPGLGTAPMARTNLPAHIEVPARRPPSLMTASPARAKLGMVRVDMRLDAHGELVDRDYGFADQDVYFLGVDDRWRSLNLAELGLPASDWTGPDGSGMGDLSSDGRHWAFVTTRQVVVLDLLARKIQLLSLPGGRAPVPGLWTAHNTLLVGSERGDGPGFEVDPRTGRSTLVKSYLRATILADGGRAMSGIDGRQPFIQYVTATGKPTERLNYGFAWIERLAPIIGQDVAVLLDSLAQPDQPLHGSTLVVVDKSLRLKASLPWPKRTAGDDPIGWIADDTFLLRYGKTMAVWCPDRTKLSRVSTVPRDLAISFAMDVVDAKCV